MDLKRWGWKLKRKHVYWKGRIILQEGSGRKENIEKHENKQSTVWKWIKKSHWSD